MQTREQQLDEYLLVCLDWIHNLAGTVGDEVLVNHKPNNTPSRLDMRRITSRPHGPLPPSGTPEHRMFVKEQLRLIRTR